MFSTTRLSIARATGDDIAHCLAIRRTVFIEEQGVAEALEVDGLDAASLHYLARLDGTPIATARVRLMREAGSDEVALDEAASDEAASDEAAATGAPTAKVQRVAVLRGARGTGAGAAIVRHLMADVTRTHGIVRFTLGSQESAVPFYERLGYRTVGERFMDAGIPHRTMVYP